MRVPVKPGCVYLVGAGPGALGLVTLRAHELIGQADVLVHDYLSNPEMLRWTRSDAEIIYAGKSGSIHTMTQDEINALLIERARAGKQVVRLKGGDPYVFGRGGEEAQVLVREEISFEVVPGVTSAIAAPAYAGIPVTHRDFASMVTFITGHEDPTKPDSAFDWRQLAQLRGTKVFLMGVERLQEITRRLIAEGADPATPVALVRWGSTPRQESLEGTLTTIADLAEKQGFRAPAVTIVGDVVKLRRELNWYEALPLFGQRVVVTRTRKQAGALTKRLMQMGADVLEIPTIRIVPLPLDDVQQGKLKTFSQHFDWVIFTSPNAVEFFFDEFFKIASDVRDLGLVKIAAMGPATAKKLNALRLCPALQPEIFTSDKLAEVLTSHIASPARFCLPHARLARPELANHLRLKGHHVEEWELYDTQPEPEDRTGVRARYLREGAHWIIFTSASTVENWHALNLQPVFGTPIPKAISMGPVTSASLKKLGYEITAEASIATVDSLVETISRLSIESRHADQ